MTSLIQRACTSASAVLAFGLAYSKAFAQDFLGPVPDIGRGDVDVRTTILDVLESVLMFMALIAVVFIVIAGIRLVVSQGEEAEKDKAKKTIIYVIIGLVIIILASAIVNFINETILGAA